MSASEELAELRASLARATHELDDAADRLAALENPPDAGEPRLGETVIVRRWRRRDSTVAAFSSVATAAVIGLLAFAIPHSDAEPKPPVVAKAPDAVPVRPEPIPPPEPVVVAREPTEPEEPPTPPPVTEAPRPPRPPVRPVALTPPVTPEMGTITVVCAPAKCDQVVDNGLVLGTGQIFSRPVAAGTHRLQLHSVNGGSKALTVEVHPDQLREVRVHMELYPASEIF